MNLRRTLIIALTLVVAFGAEVRAAFDVVIYGGTPAGIIAAVAAAREGASVVLVEPSPWIGGMVTGGLSSTDTGRQETIGGLAREFFVRAAANYGGKNLWYAEPHVNMATFQAMLTEAKVEVVTRAPLTDVKQATGGRIEALVASGRTFEGQAFVDASYEGDLMKAANVKYIVGRESRSQFDEELAGFRIERVRDFSLDVMTQACPCVGGLGHHYVHGAPTKLSAFDAQGQLLWGVARSEAQSGSADRLTQSYNFRLAVTQKAENLVPWPRPKNYEPRRYELLLRLIEAYPGIPFGRLVHLGKIAAEKYDLNAQGLFSTDYVGGNFDYPDGDPATRERIRQDHVDYVQGYFWFLVHDERVPPKLRAEVNAWGLCRDEFADNAHWPYALYVREARRMLGTYIMRADDVQTTVTKPDAVAMGSFIIDSHIVQRLVAADGTIVDEGAFDAPTRPYQIPYRAILPERAQCSNLLVPVCMSASHVAYGSIRMEPVYMSLGHAAGLAAVAAARSETTVQDIDVAALRSKLLAQKQVLEFALPTGPLASELPGIVRDDRAAEYVGAWTLSNFSGGINGGYRHDMNAGHGEKRAKFVVPVPQRGRYEVRLAYTTATNRATRVPVSIEHAGGTANVVVNERQPPPLPGGFVTLGTYEFTAERPAVIVVGNRDADGYVVVDALQLLPVE